MKLSHEEFSQELDRLEEDYPRIFSSKALEEKTKKVRSTFIRIKLKWNQQGEIQISYSDQIQLLNDAHAFLNEIKKGVSDLMDIQIERQNWDEYYKYEEFREYEVEPRIGTLRLNYLRARKASNLAQLLALEAPLQNVIKAQLEKLDELAKWLFVIEGFKQIAAVALPIAFAIAELA